MPQIKSIFPKNFDKLLLVQQSLQSLHGVEHEKWITLWPFSDIDDERVHFRKYPTMRELGISQRYKGLV